jgi:hypothetical protein
VSAIDSLEQACLEICTHCREAKRMSDRGEKGHTLRHRMDTNEWVHDFMKGSQFNHTFCYATALRTKNEKT